MMPLFDFFFAFDPSDTIQLVVMGAVVYLFFLWAALVVWVARDVVGRSKNIIFHVAALGLVIALNIFGLLVYLIIRPQKTLLERYYEDLEERTLAREDMLCTACQAPVAAAHRYCPACGKEAQKPCAKCKTLLHPTWQFCPHCHTKTH